MEKWEDLCKSDSLQNKKWLRENTKQCPRCKLSIEKNDGCFQMKCHKCRFQFCWFCLGDWATHTDHFRCSRYGVGQESLSNAPVHHDDLEDDDKDFLLLRLVSRFNDYQTSKNMAKKKEEELLDHIQSIKDQYSKTTDDRESYATHTLLQGCLPLIEQCRTFIQYMCVAQAVERKQKIIVKIQAQQETLETVTERLAQIVEVQLLAGKKDFPELKTLIKVAHQFLQSMGEQESW